MFDAVARNWPYLMTGFLLNLQLAGLALLGGIFLGMLVGLGRDRKSVV
jgi:ABC-type amino acid transport system permease subunit